MTERSPTKCTCARVAYFEVINQLGIGHLIGAYQKTAVLENSFRFLKTSLTTVNRQRAQTKIGKTQREYWLPAARTVKSHFATQWNSKKEEITMLVTTCVDGPWESWVTYCLNKTVRETIIEIPFLRIF